MTNIIPVPAFTDNYIWVLRNDQYAVVVDPGDARPVLDYLAAENLQLAAILNTHHHKDHTGGNAELLQHYAVPVYGPAKDPIPTLTHRLAEGDQVTLPELGLTFRVMEIPGHTLGHIAFYNEDTVFCGDTLFAAGCGRVFEGDPAMMLHSLDKLRALPDPTRVYCGHEYTVANIRFARTVEPDNAALALREKHALALRAQHRPTLPSTMGLEKQTNPFLREMEPAVITAANRLGTGPVETPVDVFARIREAKNRA